VVRASQTVHTAHLRLWDGYADTQPSVSFVGDHAAWFHRKRRGTIRETLCNRASDPRGGRALSFNPVGPLCARRGDESVAYSHGLASQANPQKERCV
jgi:hypothetical protein